MGKLNKITGLILSAILFVSALTGCGGSSPTSLPKDLQLTGAETEDIADSIDKSLSTSGFSGTAYAGLNSRQVFLKSYGHSESSGKEAIQNDCIYQLGSVSKLFTGAAVMKLEAEGKVKASDTLDKYFPGYGYLKNITVQNLLDMTSGFGSYTDDIKSDKKFYKKIMKKIKKNPDNYKISIDILRYILKKGPEAETGEYHYSDSGYYLLGRIISRFSDSGYAGYMEDNLIKPLGLNNTGFLFNRYEAFGYNEAEQQTVSKQSSAFNNNHCVMFAPLGIVSSAEDLNKMTDAIINNKIAKNINCLEKITEGNTGFNYGWHYDNNAVYAEGSTSLHSAYVYVNTEMLKKAIVLSNHTGVSNFDRYAKSVYNVLNSKVNGILIDNI